MPTMNPLKNGKQVSVSEAVKTSPTPMIHVHASSSHLPLRYHYFLLLRKTDAKNSQVEGRPDVVIDLTGPNALEDLKKKTFTIKEGVQYRMKVVFKVQHQILSGLKYLQVVKRGPLKEKQQEMLVCQLPKFPHPYFALCKLLVAEGWLNGDQGSYSPNTEEKPVYEKAFQPDEAPSGMLARGKYNAVSTFIDDDMKEHLRFEWSLEIKKEWPSS